MVYSPPQGSNSGQGNPFKTYDTSYSPYEQETLAQQLQNSAAGSFANKPSIGGFENTGATAEFIASLLQDVNMKGTPEQEEWFPEFQRQLLNGLPEIQKAFSEGPGVIESTSINRGIQNFAEQLAKASSSQFANLAGQRENRRANSINALTKLFENKSSPAASSMGSVGKILASIFPFLAPLLYKRFGGGGSF